MGRGCGIIVLLGGCAQIATRELRTDLPVAPAVRNTPIVDSRVYRATTAVHGPLLHVEVSQSETCVEITTERVHRTTYVARRADSRVTSSEWLVAAVGVGGGLLAYADADGIAAQNGASADGIRESAVAAAIVGLGAAAIGLIDLGRARDERRDDGVIAGDVHRREYACAQHPTGGVELAVRGVAAQLDGTGAAELDLASLAEAAFDDALVANVEGTELPLPLAPSQRRALVVALAAQPTSRIALDRLARHRDACEHAIAHARSLVPEQPDDVPATAPVAWRAAQDACDDLWTPALAAELAAIDTRIADARCRDRMTRIAFAVAEPETDPDVLSGDLVQLRAECPSLPHLDDAQRKVASLVAKHAQAVAREERARAHEEAQAQREQLRRVREQAARERSWGSASLLCNDGSLSPSCTCGGNHQGCCSHHGGIAGCSQ